MCDVCGDEQRHPLPKCSRCQKEVCNVCNDIVHVEVNGFRWRFSDGIRIDSRNKPVKTGGYTFQRQKQNGSYCVECGEVIMAELEKLGLLASDDRQNYAVVD